MRDYEESTSFLGQWGRFQCRVFFLLCLSSFPAGYNVLSVIFMMASPAHRCLVPGYSNLSQDSIHTVVPVQEVNGQLEPSSCSRYRLDQIQNLSVLFSRPTENQVQNLSVLFSRPTENQVQNLSVLFSRPTENQVQNPNSILVSGLELEDCKDGWIYNTEHYQCTVTTEFDLVCADEWKQPLTSALYFLGGLTGCFISGQISDRFGRKPALFGTLASVSVFSVLLAFAPSWPVFAVLFFLLGVGQIANFVTLFVLGSEIMTGSTRLLYTNLALPAFYVLSMALLPATAYLVRNWRHLALVQALPGLACIPLWWLIPESTRWLVSCGRLKEAELLMRSAAAENGVEAPQTIFLRADVEASAGPTAPESHSFLDLVRTGSIRRLTLILWLIWFSMSMSYFGLSFSMSGLFGNPFLNYFLLTIIEIPAYASSWLMVRSFPRRLPFAVYTLLGAAALLLIQICPDSLPGLTLSLVLLGKFGVLVSYSLMFVYSSELYPTVIRNTAISSCAMFARLGSSVSPYLVQLAEFYQNLPWIVIGSLSVLCVLLFVFLPETFRQPLPDTIQQMALIQQFRWPWASAKDHGKSAKDETAKAEVINATHL